MWRRRRVRVLLFILSRRRPIMADVCASGVACTSPHRLRGQGVATSVRRAPGVDGLGKLFIFGTVAVYVRKSDLGSQLQPLVGGESSAPCLLPSSRRLPPTYRRLVAIR